VTAASIEHVPVLTSEILAFLEKAPPKTVFDGTVGLGGHALALLERFPSIERYVGVDIDDQALERARERLAPFEKRCRLERASYEDVNDVLLRQGLDSIDCVLVDFGASTMQLKDPMRGFSFSAAGPLDMRMDRRSTLSALDILCNASAERLQQIFSAYGEFRYSKTLARAIAGLKVKPQSTKELAALVESCLPKKFLRTCKRNPSTQVFQALRIAVNDELGAIERALPQLLESLSAGGMFLAISFHSLEDRLVSCIRSDP